MVATTAQQAAAANGTAVTLNGKQTPDAPPKRMYVTYDQVHASLASLLPRLQDAGWSSPDYLIAISGGGLIPARILRGVLRNHNKNGCAAIKVIGLELYSDDLDGQMRESGVVRTQWLEVESADLLGKRILIVDEVDDSRTTLDYAVRELRKDIAGAEAALAAAGRPVPETRLAIAVALNKLKPKKGRLPDDVPEFVAEDVENDPWVVFPWDAEDLALHNSLAAAGATS